MARFEGMTQSKPEWTEASRRPLALGWAEANSRVYTACVINDPICEQYYLKDPWYDSDVKTLNSVGGNLMEIHGSAYRSGDVIAPAISEIASRIRGNLGDVSSATCSPSRCAVGMKGPGGGTVFYDAGSQQPWGRYLEAAPPGWNGTTKDPALPWCWSNATVVLTKLGSGDGAANSAAIEGVCGPLGSGPYPNIAAKAAREYRGGGLSDWYLPSLRELRDMAGAASIVGGLSPEEYWSSSQASDSQKAWYLNKPYDECCGNVGRRGNVDFKTAPSRVRPIRAFS